MPELELNFTKRDDLVPVCPHCSAELRNINIRTKGVGWIEGKNVVYFCPECRKVLGFGQSRMM